MNTPFFSTAVRLAALSKECARWKGTPFVANAGPDSKPKVAADCVGLVTGIWRRFGLIEPQEWPPYVCNGGDAMLALILERLDRIPALARAEAPWMPGDGLVLSSQRLTHLCLFESMTRVWHCWPKHGVLKGNGHALVKRTCIAVFRPVVIDCDRRRP